MSGIGFEEIAEKIRRQLEESIDVNEKKNVNESNTQTDLTNLDLKELKQPLALIKQRRGVETELQDVKDRIFQLQCESKLKTKEGSEAMERFNKENVSLSQESRSQKTTMEAMDAKLKESLKVENGSKMLSHTLKETQIKSANLNQNLRETQVKLAVEENVSGKSREKLLESLKSQEFMIRSIRLKTLEIDYNAKRSFLEGKKRENYSLLNNVSHFRSKTGPASASFSLKAVIMKLRFHSEQLDNSLKNLDIEYRSISSDLEKSQGDHLARSFELKELSRELGMVPLSSSEVDNLRSLAISRLATPTLGGFAGSESAPTRPFGRPPGFAAPPPHQSRGGRDGVLAPPVSRTSPAAAPYPGTRSPPLVFKPTLATNPPVIQPDQAPPGNRPAPAPGPALHTSKKAVMVEKLVSRYPDMTSEEAGRHLAMVRVRNKGRLSGLSIAEILGRVRALWEAERGRGGSTCPICMEGAGQRQGADQVWRQLQPCLHSFHAVCIEAWLGREGGDHTCPVCRHLVLLEEDSPTLQPRRN